MKHLINISGGAGFLLLLFRFIGIFKPLPYNDVLLFAGLAIVICIFLPFYLLDRYRNNRVR